MEPNHSTPKFIVIVTFLHLLLLCLMHNAFAEAVGWHEHFGGNVGLGLDLRNQSITKPRVAFFDTANVTNYSGTGDQSISVFFAQHTLDMAKSFSLNANVSLSYEIYSGSVGFNFADQQTFSQNSLTFVFDCTRNFGDTAPTFLRLDPDFTNVVNSLKQTYSGGALHQAITDLYGSDVVYGYRGSAKVVVVYEFQYASSSIARQTAASVQANYQLGFDSGSFNGFVSGQFQQSHTEVSLNVHFWSSDPSQPPSFPVATNLTTYDQFVSYSAQVQNYCANMNPANAKRTGYLVEPIQSLPGYLSLIVPFIPTNVFNTSYDQFVKVYARLKSWDNLFLSWIIDGHHMSWMNSNGQALVFAIRQDTRSYLDQLEQTARAHFLSGADLKVPNEIINYFVNFNRIPIPTIHNQVQLSAATGNGMCGGDWLIGAIDCGSLDLAETNPFPAVILAYNGVPDGRSESVYYSFNDFEQRIQQSSCEDFKSWYTNTFSKTAQWIALRQAASQKRIGLFLLGILTGPSLTSVAIKDATGSVVDQQQWFTITPTPSGSPLQAASSVDTSLGIRSSPASGTAGTSFAYSFSVTNNGPGAAYGTKVTLPLDTNRFDFVSVTGSQGQGSFTNGTVSFDLGPLAPRSVGTIQLRVVPVASGLMQPVSQAQVATAAGITDPNAANNQLTLSPVQVNAPKVSITRSGSQMEVSWTSETDRIVLEQASTLQSTNVWTPASGPVLANGSDRKITVSPSAQRRFFRLRGI